MFLFGIEVLMDISQFNYVEKVFSAQCLLRFDSLCDMNIKVLNFFMTN